MDSLTTISMVDGRWLDEGSTMLVYLR